ncbi:hypothetical protein KAFR_0A04790 [Kazachstania africana CBS 2517]|uniref:Matrin-type domain-containing protein n=1 Tax=Kazachstania africana (strain ATCC 22294 / BCRC 22015 / CBS 2517 / CECT 1963 / NBRC 1671 / NRRL Y-8276) TaxID=1071382 RepID=H2ANG4_KAZAF|nr:hypothetical protein KAFR_0A04790 [Kazachstania africana CBS 2517]CCF55914.1 hypothetical protein KAFR_0A04790 [Kazachstania africana CBS 2517]
MARYYCEYCHSYLTHDTLSVRKSHLIGKNHLKITADYYRNKYVELHEKRKVKNHNRKRNGKGQNEGQKPITLRCPKNKEKKQIVKLNRLYHDELNNTKLDTLSKLYEGSPGYSKVFIDRNRFDIGDLVKMTRLPQRANVVAGSNSNINNGTSMENRTRNEVFVNHYNEKKDILPPPMILSRWSNTLPKTSTFNDNNAIINTTIQAYKTRLQTKRPTSDVSTSTNYKRRKY